MLRSLLHRNSCNRVLSWGPKTWYTVPWNPDWHNRNLSVLQISHWLNSELWYWRWSISEPVAYFNHQPSYQPENTTMNDMNLPEVHKLKCISWHIQYQMDLCWTPEWGTTWIYKIQIYSLRKHRFVACT